MARSLLQIVERPDDIDEQYEIAELIIRYLEQLNIDYVFGIPGGAIEPIYDALARSEYRNSVRAINACHESAAAYMADGYYRETGKLGVCLATSGPGSTSLITGVACAYDNKIPLLVLTGQPAIPSFGKGAFQESSCSGVDVLSMFRHCTHYSSLVSHHGQLETKLANALLTAHQSKGPTHLSIPVDILRKAVKNIQPRYNIAQKLNQKTFIADGAPINELTSLLAKYKQPVVFIGSGAVEAIDSIMALIELTGALFVTTPDAKGLINPSNVSYRGVFGLGGHDSAAETLQKNQSITLAFGTDFSEFSSQGWSDSLLNEKLIHIDETNDNLLRSPMARLHVHGHLLTICNRLIEQLLTRTELSSSTKKHKEYSERINPNIKLQEPEKYHSDTTPIKPQRLMKELSERFPPQTRFLADTGNSMMWAPHYLHPHNRRKKPVYTLIDNCYAPSDGNIERRSGNANWLSLSMNFAPMGWAIGASIGIARGNSNNPTVCITGDGAYLMSGQEITIAAQEQLPVIFVIMNNGTYGMVMHGQRLAGAEPIAFNLHPVNFAKLVEAMNIPGYIIESPTDFDAINFDELLSRKGPSLLDVRIDNEEVPPLASRIKILTGNQQQ